MLTSAWRTILCLLIKHNSYIHNKVETSLFGVSFFWQVYGSDRRTWGLVLYNSETSIFLFFNFRPPFGSFNEEAYKVSGNSYSFAFTYKKNLTPKFVFRTGSPGDLRYKRRQNIWTAQTIGKEYISFLGLDKDDLLFGLDVMPDSVMNKIIQLW